MLPRKGKGTQHIDPDKLKSTDFPDKTGKVAAPGPGVKLDIEWVKSRSDEELISLIHVLSTELNLRKIRFTDTVPVGSIPQNISLDDEDINVDHYLRKPHDAGPKAPFADRPWKIILVCLDKEKEPLGLEIVGDVSIGRLTEESSVDIDLNPFQADERGVSREHAMLRPTENNLILSDLGSTNGTYYEGVKVMLGSPKPIKSGSVISFGKLNFWVKIVSSPIS